MTNHRITLITMFSAIALCAAPPLTAQTNDTSKAQATTGQSSAAGTSTTSTDPTTRDPARAEDATANQPNPNQSQATQRASSGDVKPASKEAEELSLDKLKGQRLRDAEGNELGKVHDFVIDRRSGEIAHAVVSTGGILGMGDKLRLVPAAGLEQSAMEGFRTDLQQTQFEALPLISEKDLKAGRMTASQQTGDVVRASELKDKSIRSDDQEVGEIEDVAIDFNARKAMALIETKSGFAGEKAKFLVPFSKLEIRSEREDHITSSLLRSDFTKEQTRDTRRTTVSSPSIATTGATAGGGVTGSTAERSTSGATAAATTTPGSSATSGDRATGVTNPSSTDASSRVTDTTSPSGATASTATAAPDVATTNEPTYSRGPGDIANAPRETINPSPAPSTTDDEQLAPTGRTSAEQGPASAAAAMAIRQALDRDSTVAREDVQVTTKIVLRGSVESEEAKNRIEDLAKKAANNAEIENQITVQQK